MTKATLTPKKQSMTSVVSHMDRWENQKNSFGTGSDPITQTRFQYGVKLSRQELDAMFRFDWLARRVVEIPAEDATREWITLTHDTKPKLAELVRDEMERLKIRESVEEGIKLGGLYGGALMTIGAFDGREVHQPLGSVRSVEFLNLTDRWLTFPQTYYNDPMDMRFGMPETYIVQRLQVQGSMSSTIHESRTIRFEGDYLPPVERVKNWGWSESVLQSFLEALRNFGVANQSSSAVLEDFITKKMKVDNLAELLTTEEGSEQLINRISILAYSMSMHKVAVFGADEEFDKMGTPVTGLHELLKHGVDIVSAAAGIPKGRLFHNQTGILGGDAGGDDLRVHYDQISAYQENTLRPKIRRIIDIVSETFGIGPGEINFTYNPLWQLSETDEAEVRLKTAQTDKIYIDAGVVHPEEVALSRFSGDETNLTNMTIDVDSRQKYLDELYKQPIDLDEGDPDKDEIDPNNVDPDKEKDAEK